MTQHNNEIIQKILDERERQRERFGSEYDLKKGPNDWASIMCHYATRECLKNSNIQGDKPKTDNFEDSIVKSIAVGLAALENIQNMKDNGYLE